MTVLTAQNTWHSPLSEPKPMSKPELPPIEDAAAMMKETPRTAPMVKSLGELQPRQPSGKIVINSRNNTATLHYAYPYEIDLDRIHTERDLLAWALHLCEKNWIDTERLREVVSAIAKHKGLDVHSLQTKAAVTQDWPVVTTNSDPGEVREWVHETPPRYYLFQPKTGEYAGQWVVIDRVYDLADGRHYKRKTDCIRAFVRAHDRRQLY